MTLRTAGSRQPGARNKPDPEACVRPTNRSRHGRRPPGVQPTPMRISCSVRTEGLLLTHAEDHAGCPHGEDDAKIFRDRRSGGEGESAVSIHHRFAGADNTVEHQLRHAEQEQEAADSTLSSRLLGIRDPCGE